MYVRFLYYLFVCQLACVPLAGPNCVLGLQLASCLRMHLTAGHWPLAHELQAKTMN